MPSAVAREAGTYAWRRTSARWAVSCAAQCRASSNPGGGWLAASGCGAGSRVSRPGPGGGEWAPLSAGGASGELRALPEAPPGFCPPRGALRLPAHADLLRLLAQAEDLCD